MSDKTVTMSRELVRDFIEYSVPISHDDEKWYAQKEELRAILVAPVVERQPVADSIAQMVTEWVETGIKMNMDWRNGLSGIIEKRLARFPVSPPAPVAVAMTQHPFADKVIRKLRRFQSCAEDGQGADIGRHWFDLLTQLGLLNRVQRSPALWEITQQGEDCLQKTKEDE